MSVWVWSAGAGVAIGVTVFFLVLVPLLAWQYRSFGRLSIGRLIGAAAVSVYAAALMAYTQLPLPETRSLAWCEAYGVHDLQLVPFESFNTMLMRASEIGWGAMLTSTLGLQVIFNVLLFIPWGVIVRGYFHTSILAATLSGVLGSLLIEVTQATGLWGVYPCAYRLGDVDDLLTNTIGALIGAVIAPLFLFWMPKREVLREEKFRARPVTATRRILAMFLNYGMVWTVSTVSIAIIGIVWRFVDGKINLSLFEGVQFWVHTLTVVCVIFVPALQGKGSLGLQIVWLHPRWRKSSGAFHRGTVLRRLARAAVLGVPLILSGIPGAETGTSLFAFLAFVAFVMVPFTLTHRSLSGWITRAEMVDTRSR